MDITLQLSVPGDAAAIHTMQIRAFSPLLEKYRDHDTSPANETVERIRQRIEQPQTDYYRICRGEEAVGAIRIVRGEESHRISPLFVLPEHQGQGISQRVFALIERMYPEARRWELETVLQEAGNCYLYEKVGYRLTGERKVVNDRMTLVSYGKEIR